MKNIFFVNGFFKVSKQNAFKMIECYTIYCRIIFKKKKIIYLILMKKLAFFFYTYIIIIFFHNIFNKSKVLLIKDYNYL